MTQEDWIIYGTLAVVTLIVIVMIVWGVRVRREQDARSLALTAAEIKALTQKERVGDTFLWCIWQNRLSSSHFYFHVINENDETLTEARLYFIPQNGMKAEYRFNGKNYRIMRESLASTRTLLVANSDMTPLMAMNHTMGSEHLLASDLKTERCKIHNLNLFKETRRISVGERDIGAVFMVKQLDFHVRVLSLRPNTLTLEEQLFLLVDLSD